MYIQDFPQDLINCFNISKLRYLNFNRKDVSFENRKNKAFMSTMLKFTNIINKSQNVSFRCTE